MVHLEGVKTTALMGNCDKRAAEPPLFAQANGDEQGELGLPDSGGASRPGRGSQQAQLGPTGVAGRHPAQAWARWTGSPAVLPCCPHS